MARSLRQELIQVRCVTSAQHLFCVEPCQFLQEYRWFRLGKKRLGSADFLFGKMKDLGGNFTSLPGAQQRAGENRLRLGSQLKQADERLARLLSALFGEWALGIWRAIGFLAVHRDAVTNQINEHSGSLYSAALFAVGHVTAPESTARKL